MIAYSEISKRQKAQLLSNITYVDGNGDKHKVFNDKKAIIWIINNVKDLKINEKFIKKAICLSHFKKTDAIKYRLFTDFKAEMDFISKDILEGVKNNLHSN